MAEIDRPVAVVDESAISAAIVSAITSKARELAATYAASYRIEGEPRTRIKGYATPKQSLVAVAFDVRFPLKRIEPIDDGDGRSTGRLRVGGTSSYDPITGNISDIEIGDYSVSAGDGSWGTVHLGDMIGPAWTEYI